MGKKNKVDLSRVGPTLRDLIDPGKCWFDHHGGCQEHGYLSLEQGDLCPHEEAKRLLADPEIAKALGL